MPDFKDTPDADGHLGPIPRPYTSGDDEREEKPELQRVPLDALPLSPYEAAVRDEELAWYRERTD